MMTEDFQTKIEEMSVLLTEEEQEIVQRRIHQIVNRHVADMKRNLAQNRLKLKKTPQQMMMLKTFTDVSAINEIWLNTGSVLLHLVHQITKHESLKERQKKLKGIKASFLKDISQSMDEDIAEFLAEKSDSEES